MSRLVTFIGLAGLLMPAAVAEAKPSAPAIFCMTYPASSACSGHTVECTYCHVSTAPPAWNPYGQSLRDALMGKDFDSSLAGALQSVAGADADADGVSNQDEIAAGALPGAASDAANGCDDAASQTASYDFGRAFRRAYVLYCGRSPNFDERQAFDGLSNQPDAQRKALGEALDRCLSSTYWRDDGVQRLADPRVRPVEPVGRTSKTAQIIIGDYEWDYRLWAYILTGDRDMRDLLRADYHVEADAQGSLVKKTGTFAGTAGIPGFSPTGQPLPPEQRAGMITTAWFFAVNTMFSQVPRTTAAQAYRAYLGQDIALQQGLTPVPNEPADIDGRGTDAPVCRDCHSTLDPMSYAFIKYEGIKGPRTGVINDARAGQVPGWKNNQGMLLGQPITDVRDWARVALASELFPRNLATMFLRHAIERDPTSAEQADFDAIWRSIPGDAWSANKLIHRIVDSRFFGGGK